MNAELEALVQSLEGLITAGSGADADRMEEIYQSRIEEVLLRHPGLSREQLLHLVDFAHRRWVQAKKRFPTLPPKA